MLITSAEVAAAVAVLEAHDVVAGARHLHFDQFHGYPAGVGEPVFRLGMWVLWFSPTSCSLPSRPLGRALHHQCSAVVVHL